MKIEINKDLLIYDIPTHSDDWYLFRTIGIDEEKAKKYKQPAYESGVGGSECGTVFGLNPYDHAARLFNYKTGLLTPPIFDSEILFWGREHEDVIAKMWEYFDNTEEGYIDNYKKGNKIRECVKQEGYIVNPKYPFMFASVDRLIAPGCHKLSDGSKLDRGGVLELKTINSMEANKWIEGVPEFYKIQVHHYMIVLELDYAEIALLVDGRKLRVEVVERDEELCKSMISILGKFWTNRVLEGRKALKMGVRAREAFHKEGIAKWEGYYQRLEPEPDENEAYKDFMKEKFRVEVEAIPATLFEEENATKYKFWKEIEKLVKIKCSYFYNLVIHHHDLKKAEKLQYEGKGNHSTYSQDTNGAWRLNVRLPSYRFDQKKKDRLFGVLTNSFKTVEGK